MAVDLTKNYWGRVDVSLLASGATVSEEGQGLISVIEDGIAKVRPSANAASETFAGLALFRQLSFSNRPVVLGVSVPSSAAYEIETGHTNLIAGQLRVVDVLLGTALTVVGIAPTAGEVQVDNATGLLTFNVAQAGRAMTVTLRYNMTVAEATMLYQQAAVNYPNANMFEQVGVAKGKCQFHVAFYDATVNWAAVTAGTIRLGVNGIISTTAGGATGALIPGARVVQVPSSENGAFLGIEYLA